MKILREAFRTPRMLRTTLSTAFFLFSAVMLLLYATVETSHDFQIHGSILSRKQQHAVQDAAKAVRSFIDENFNILETTVRVTNLDAVPEAEQSRILQSLLELRSAFRQMVLLNARNQILARSSRLPMDGSERLMGRFKDSLQGQDGQAQRTISPVYIDPVTSEPMVTTSVAVTNVPGDFRGTLIAELSLKSMWDIVHRLKVGETGYTYVCDRKGTLLAFEDTARVLKGENVSHLKVVAGFLTQSRLGRT